MCNSVGDKGGEWGAQSKGVFAQNIILSAQKPCNERISCEAQHKIEQLREVEIDRTAST